MRDLARRRPFIALIYIFLFFAQTPFVNAQKAQGGKAKPDVTADAAILIDAETGQVLYEKNAHQRRDPASTTKIMTALLAFEYGKLNDEVVISRRAALTPGSSMYLRRGERYRLGDLLKGLMLVSGNDAAEAIAEHIAGSGGDFAILMTARAREMGLRETRFRNPHGLTQRGHYTSAHDLAMITREALMRRDFADLVCTAEGSACGSDQKGKQIMKHFRNTNQLLFSYQWADGVKTGTTAAAGRCLVASATKYGQQLISVVLHSNDRWGDSRRLLDYGFATYTLRNFAPAGEVVRHVPVRGGVAKTVAVTPEAHLTLVVKRDDIPRIRTVINTAPQLDAPVTAGERVGSLTVLLDGEVLGRTPLITAAAVRKAPPWQGLFQWISAQKP